MEEIIDLKSVIRFFYKKRKKMLFIAIGSLIIINAVFFMFKGFIYTSTGKIRLSADATTNKIASYRDFILSDKIVDNAISNSKVNVDKKYVKNNLSLNANVGSKIYTITLKYNNKEDGKKICEFIVNEFINRIELYDGSRATIYDAVEITNESDFIRIIKNELIYIVISTIVSVSYAFVAFFLDKKIKSISELNSCNILGIINKSKDNINLIKTKIKLNDLGNVIFINTPREIDCKNELLELIKDFSEDSKVLFIDSNIRNKSKKEGYSNLLKGYKDNISKYINSGSQYDIIESGTNNKEIESLLSSKNNEKIINAVKKKYDYVIIYNSNVVDYSDSLIISKLSDFNYMIVGINQTNKRDFDKALESYKQINTVVNGIIVIDNE